MSYFRLPYRRQRGVDSHSGSILALAVTKDGKTLATGGSQGTRLFDMGEMSEIKRPSSAGSCGHTVSLLWAQQTEEPYDVLYSGTQNGYFVCWRRDKESKAFEETLATQITHAGEITGLGFDSTNNRLCLCSRTDIVQSWAISKDAITGLWRATNIFSQKYSNFVPRSITFAAFDNSSNRDILVFGSGHNGPVYTLRGASGEMKSTWGVQSYIGGIAVNWSEGVFCVSDPYNGPALFRYANRTRTNSFEVPRERQGGPCASDVCFGEKGSIIVTGSDHGKIYIFDVRSGDTVQELETSRAKRVKAVTTAEIGGESAIIAAHSYNDEGFQQIFVWKRGRSPIAWETVVTFLQALVLLGFVVFVYQNVGGKFWGKSQTPWAGKPVDSL
ncbi:WD40-repeat-containing domain protein [Mycena galopus ATCC 62051]|nr:WD40-repeat-containing domain protein [Mycena galopus ATCC 62051]KAF8206592.1 WD40-repeat-containing domain protein [Mycena galopus ATCC 62051]